MSGLEQLRSRELCYEFGSDFCYCNREVLYFLSVFCNLVNNLVPTCRSGSFRKPAVNEVVGFDGVLVEFLGG